MPGEALLDESGSALLDEAGQALLDEGVTVGSSSSSRSAVGFSTTEWLDLGVAASRVDAFRFDLVSPERKKIGELSTSTSGGRVENNIHAAIKRTLTAVFAPNSLNDVNMFQDRLRPVMILPNGAEYPLGVFMFADAVTVWSSYGADVSPTLVDQTLVVDQAIERSFGVPSRSSVRDAIVRLLSDAGIDAVQIDVDGTPRAPLSWPPGTSRLSIINDLAGIAGGYSLFFDSEGTARVIEVPDVDTASLTYSTSSPRIFRGSIIRSDDTLDSPNRFIVIGATGDATEKSRPVSGFYDVPASAPHSFENRGYRVTRAMEVQGLTSNSECYARARVWAKQSSANYEWLSFGSPLDPRHDTFDVVRVDIGDGRGLLTYREQGWSMDLSVGGQMVHDLRRSYDA